MSVCSLCVRVACLSACVCMCKCVLPVRCVPACVLTVRVRDHNFSVFCYCFSFCFLFCFELQVSVCSLCGVLPVGVRAYMCECVLYIWSVCARAC